jgi:hypothetical protein
MTDQIANLKVNQKIRAPMPFSGEATIVGFRYHTSRNTGRTYMAVDYVTDDGKCSFDSLEKILKHTTI